MIRLLMAGTAIATILATATTDANGWFTFYGLAAGQYRLQFVLPTGYQFTLKQQGTVFTFFDHQETWPQCMYFVRSLYQ